MWCKGWISIGTSPIAPFRSGVDRVKRRPTPSLDGRTRSPLLEKRPPTGVLFTAAAEIGSQRGRRRCAALIVLIFPMSAGVISSRGRLAGKACLLSRRRCDPGAVAGHPGGGRTHVEFVSEVAASGESAVLSTSAFAIQMRRRES